MSKKTIEIPIYDGKEIVVLNEKMLEIIYEMQNEESDCYLNSILDAICHFGCSLPIVEGEEERTKAIGHIEALSITHERFRTFTRR